MIFSTRNRILKLTNPTPFKMRDIDIKFVKSHVYLGVTLDCAMTLDPLFKSLNKRVTNKLFTLRKLRKFITKDASILIYKQTILPLIDYIGFLLLACNVEQRESIQILQNDILRTCCGYKLSDGVSIALLHKECNIISIEQRNQRQLLWLMYLLSKGEMYRKTVPRNTRSASKVNFKVPTKITRVYEHSPYYKGTKLWDNLHEAIQKADNVFIFKKEIAKTYRNYRRII